ncbi:MAG TPA: FAD-linked oxidase C-terminal domain-containing protein, partial [Puia sp.]|nr:FAD-linked oxidase C-terminal domain-containing protein [Puia sp.]
MSEQLHLLASQLEGELYEDTTTRILYATDASAYRELPRAVAVPRSVADIRKLISYAHAEKTSLIPRTAGTSLAGQVVGNGIVVDVSKYFNGILELNAGERWVRVQPGVVRDDLNLYLRPHGLMFGPETSTANRAMIGGMVGNNSCGSNSIVYRSTREHLLEVKALLSDGTEACFSALPPEEFHARCEDPGTEGRLYRQVRSILGNYENQLSIRKEFPKRSVERRNTGYALDLLVEASPFTAGGPDFNFCTLLAGSEGTLAFITEIRLNLSPLPPKETGLLCVHFRTIDESLRANLLALRYGPTAVELIDHYILECTKDNIEQRKNRFFVLGDPGAILVIEFRKDNREEIAGLARQLEADMRAAGLGYEFPLLFGEDTKKIWNLRKAGLGLLSNLPGDDKAVPVIEDTAVDVADLPAYIREFNDILKKYHLHSVHYAHAGSGEIHLRPIINLKTMEGNELFRTIAEEIAALVKKYRGSLSGEHGDGRLRGEFIPAMVGERNYRLMREIKQTWDPAGIFNPGKIVDTPPMNSMLRYEPGQHTPAFPTIFRFHRQNILQHAEQCNGSGDCRKTHLSGGTMCPSFMATRNEKDTTRARANILREFLTHSPKDNRYDHREIYEVMDLCLSCKGCKSECPSNVDMAKLKAEFMQHYQDANGVPLRSRVIASFSTSARIGSWAPGLYNRLVNARWVKKWVGFAPGRSLPLLRGTTVRHWYEMRQPPKPVAGRRRVYLFCDEFTNYNDVEIGKTTVLLLERLGYEVVIPRHEESGRTWLSKGLVRRARDIANQNIRLLQSIVSAETPLIGVEPSAILTFRDEYPDLADESLLPGAALLAANSYLIDDFLAQERDEGHIRPEQFTTDHRKVVLHGHCQQKALTTAA